jgi:DNA-binding winged helix-turn-helix (wHTH) protein
MRVSFGEFVLDAEQRQLTRGGSPVHLTPKALSLLECLVEKRHSAVSKSEIMSRLWPATFVTESSLTTLVKELRGALGDCADEPRYVRGVRGFGYAFCAQASPDSRTPSPAATSGQEFRLTWQTREIALVPGENLLGRTHEAMVWVDDPSVSRQHAVIRVGDGRAVIEDCGSRNGTWIRGERITSPRELERGDEIWLGKATLAFCVYSADEPTAPVDENEPRP